MPASQSHPDSDLQQSIQQSLQAIAAQLGEPIDPAAAQQLYQEAVDLLDHLACTPLTLARLAGTLLVYRLQKGTAEELGWLQTQIQAATEVEAVEELIESMHRTDAL